MSRAKNLGCRCRYKLPQAALQNPFLNVEGKHGPDTMLFAPICRSTVLLAMRPPLDEDGEIDDTDPEYGEVWSVESEFDLIFKTGDPARPYMAKTTVTSFAVGGVVTELRYADVDGLIAKYENMNPYEPHRGLTMRLVDYDTTADAVNWQDYCCLRPAVVPPPVGDCAACDDDSTYSFLFVVTPAGYGAPPGFEDDFRCDCEQFSRSLVGVGGGNVCTYGEIRTDGCPESVGYSFAAGVAIIGSDTPEIRYGRSDLFFTTYVWSAFPDRTACDIAKNGGRFSLTYNGSDPLYCDNDGPVEVEIIPLTSNGESRTSDVDCAPKYCGGVSQWHLREKCRANDTAIYSWERYSDVCKGECSSDECRATVPFQLFGAETFAGDSERMSDVDATDRGYRAAVEGNVLIDGGCDCDPAPAEPVCSEQCSTWTPARALCDDGKYLYFWTGKDSTCSADCGETPCVPTIPDSPVMPETTMSDTDAEAYFGMPVATLLATDYIGGCGCVDAYVAPECPPPCETCEDVTGAKTFTGGGHSWTLVKGDDPCGFDETCCWGHEIDGNNTARLFWDTGVWTLVIVIDTGSGLATANYTLTAGVCVAPLVLDFSSSGGASYSWPATISVS